MKTGFNRVSSEGQHKQHLKASWEALGCCFYRASGVLIMIGWMTCGARQISFSDVLQSAHR